MLSLARLGAVAGALVALLPALATAIVTTTAVHAMRQTVDGWRVVRLPLPTPPATSINFVALLGLQRLLETLRWWDGAPLFLMVLVTLAVVALGALAGAAVGLALATLCNASARLGGGIVLEAELTGAETGLEVSRLDLRGGQDRLGR